MGENFYLNPGDVRNYCYQAISKLEKMNSMLESSKQSINDSEFFELTGNAADSIEAHMRLYLYIVQKYIDANNADINDFQILRDSVGYDVLDSGAIDWAQSIIDKENNWISDAISSNNRVLGKLSKKGDDAKRAFYKAANYAANAQIELNKRIKSFLDNKRNEYYRIEGATQSLFQNGAVYRWIANLYLAQIQKGYYDAARGMYIYPNNKLTAIDAIRLLKRPEGMSDEKWQEYYNHVLNKLNELSDTGWSYQSICVLVNEINTTERNTKTDAEVVDELVNQSNSVGSAVYMKMWFAWPAVTQEDAEEKLRFFYNHVGMGELKQSDDGKSYIVGNQSLDEMLNKFSNDLDPNNAFWADYAALVRTAAPNGLITGDGIDTDFYRNIHQFRYVIDAQQVEYIRNNYDGKTDEDKLANYIKENNLKQGDDWDFESARLHNKINGSSLNDSSYPGGKFNANYKVLISNAFNSEFIMDSSGNFVYVLDETEDLARKKNSIVNGASFNYATENDYKGASSEKDNKTDHGKYDVDAGKSYDPEFRKSEYKSINDTKKYNISVIHMGVLKNEADFLTKVF